MRTLSLSCTLSHTLFLKKFKEMCFLPRKEVSQLKMKLSRLRPRMLLLVQPKHLWSQPPEASGGKWPLATPSRAAPHGPLPTLPPGTLPAFPATAGWAYTCLGRQSSSWLGGEDVSLAQAFQPGMLQLLVQPFKADKSGCPKESTCLSNQVPGSVP